MTKLTHGKLVRQDRMVYPACSSFSFYKSGFLSMVLDIGVGLGGGPRNWEVPHLLTQPLKSRSGLWRARTGRRLGVEGGQHQHTQESGGYPPVPTIAV